MAGLPWSSGRSWRSRGVNSAPVSGELVALPVRLGQSRGVLYWKSDWLGLSSSRWARLAESCIGNRGVRDCVSAALQAMSRLQRDTTLCKRYNTCKVWYRCESGGIAVKTGPAAPPGSMVATTGREPLIGAGEPALGQANCLSQCTVARPDAGRRAPWQGGGWVLAPRWSDCRGLRPDAGRRAPASAPIASASSLIARRTRTPEYGEPVVTAFRSRGEPAPLKSRGEPAPPNTGRGQGLRGGGGSCCRARTSEYGGR